MITLVCGVPGAGKSLYAVDLILDELRFGNRDIITNLAIFKDSVAQYLHDKFGDSFNTRDRLIVVQDLQRFWELRKRETLFVLDECQIFFSARNWANSPPELLAYLSQHRKLGDDVIAISQHYQLIEKQFRQLVQESIFLKNLSYIKFFGVKMPKRIVGNKYYGIPATAMEKPLEVFTKSIDVKGICQLYDTGAGVGVKGNADKKRCKKGLPWYMAPILFMIVLVGVYFAIGQFSKFAIKKSIKFSQPAKLENRKSEQILENSEKESLKNATKTSLNDMAGMITPAKIEKSNEVLYTGFYALPGKSGRLISSDGHIYEVLAVSEIGIDTFSYLLVDGKQVTVNWQEQSKKVKDSNYGNNEQYKRKSSANRPGFGYWN